MLRSTPQSIQRKKTKKKNQTEDHAVVSYNLPLYADMQFIPEIVHVNQDLQLVAPFKLSRTNYLKR